jgi:phage repressor protein C with HTH and peptisase S24 domain
MAKARLVREIERRMVEAGLTQKALALKAGLNETAVRDIRIGRSRNPRAVTLARIAAALGVKPEELTGRNGSAPAAHGPSAARERETADEFAYVALYDVAAGAGRGRTIERSRAIGRLAFRKDWLRNVTAAAADELALITVRGDSMVPTLMDGDTVLLDRTDSAVRRDGVYVILHDGLLLIKRLQIDPARGKVIISCDNRDYPPLPAVDAKSIDVAGRVIWVGRRI